MVPDGCMAADTIAKLPMVSVVSVENGAKNGMLQGLGYRGVLHTMVSAAFGEKSVAPDTSHRARPSPMNPSGCLGTRLL